MSRKVFSHLVAFVATLPLLLIDQPAADAKNLTRAKVVQTASVMKGVPYVYGGTSPRGFDCSGLVQYVFAKANIQMPRTADRQFNVGSPVPYAKAKPGDLMFFNTGKLQGMVTHVGIYMGNGHMLHAPRPGKSVQFASVESRSWFRPRLLGIRRVNKQTYALSRKPVGWEIAAMPTHLELIVPQFKTAGVQTASL
jgi:hypothetical protein